MSGHILVDLDGTLAEYHGWEDWDCIGNAVPSMLERVKLWLSHGTEVKIFTARACTPEAIPVIKEWLVQQGLPELEVINFKTYETLEIWDDRARQVEFNTGELFGYTHNELLYKEESAEIRGQLYGELNA